MAKVPGTTIARAIAKRARQPLSVKGVASFWDIGLIRSPIKTREKAPNRARRLVGILGGFWQIRTKRRQLPSTLMARVS